MERPETQAPDSAAAALAGKYMTFKLADEEYGIELLRVRELIGLLPITKIPGTRPYVSGVINLRGKVIPVIDLRRRFDLPAVTLSEVAVIIVVQTERAGRLLTMGILVDEVVEVLNITAAQIEPLPSVGVEGEAAEFILGVGKADRRVVCLLDVARVLSEDAAAELSRIA